MSAFTASTFIAFQDHYANLLNDYAERLGCTLEESLNKLDTSLTIERQDDEMYSVYDFHGDLICELESELLTAYVDHDFDLPDFIETNIEELLDCPLVELVGFDEDSPVYTAAQTLAFIDQFKQELEAEKAGYSVEISAGTRQFAPNIFVKKVGWEFEITCDSYLYNPGIPGRGVVPFTQYVKPDEHVKQVLKNNTFTSGDIEEFKELLIVAARFGKLRALLD